MTSLITKWAFFNYGFTETVDYSELFSQEVDDGWTIRSISTAVDHHEGKPIIIFTALLEKPDTRR